MLHLGMVYRRVGRQEFIDTLAAAKRERGDHGLCVSEPEASAALFLAADGQSGYALDGANLGSVFSLAKGRLAGIIRDAKARALRDGKRCLYLDCFAPLEAVYARHGWVTNERAKFDWKYAPQGWASRHGEPDVCFMHLPLSAALIAA